MDIEVFLSQTLTVEYAVIVLIKFVRNFSLCVVFFSAAFARAHPLHLAGGGVVAGFTHPFLGLDHLLAMVAVGLLAAKIRGAGLFALPAAFVVLMAAGGLLNSSGIAVPFVEQSIAASVFVFGLLLARSGARALPMSLAFVALFAVFHGHAHVAEIGRDHSPLGYIAGFLTGTAVLHGVGIAAGLFSARTSGLFYKLSGAGIAACGAVMCFNALG